MWAVVIGLSVLMWMWAAAGLHLVPLLEKGGNYPVRMAYAAVIIAIGATLLLLLPWLVLPGSVLSRGWTLKVLESTQQLSLLLVLLTALAAFLRARFVFLPPALPKPALATPSAPARSAPPKQAAAKPAQKKRRP
jgi:hypothetical protein